MFAALVLLASASRTASEPSPLGCAAAARSVVVHGGARFTVLSSKVIRLEAPPFDDRCTFSIVSRSSELATSTKFASKVDPASGALTIETSAVVLKYTPAASPPPAPAPQCQASLRNNTDVASGRRVPGAAATLFGASLEDCCEHCRANQDCMLFIYGMNYGPNPRPRNSTITPNCWLMQSAGAGTEPQQGPAGVRVRACVCVRARIGAMVYVCSVRIDGACAES